MAGVPKPSVVEKQIPRDDTKKDEWADGGVSAPRGEMRGFLAMLGMTTKHCKRDDETWLLWIR